MSREHEQIGPWSFDTCLIHDGHETDAPIGAVVPPLHPSTTFARNANYDLIGEYVYARYSSPTARMVESLAAQMDRGSDALLFSSGLAGFVALFETVMSGQHIVAPQIMYHGAQDWLRRIAETREIGLTFFDVANPQGLTEALRAGETAVVWIESPVNPTWDAIDIRAAAEAAHGVGAILAVDSTVAPPVTTRPIEHGADLVFHSASKYLNGHSDVLAGILVTSKENDRWDEIRMIRKLQGSVSGPFEAWLLLRGLRTLSVRFERASASALLIAQELEGHPAVSAVLYPGLESHPSHAVARRQMTGGFGGMLSLLLEGSIEDARALATRTRLFIPATSLGGIESLIEHRASVEGPHSRVPGNLVRLSIGMESAADLLEDLHQALAETR